MKRENVGVLNMAYVYMFLFALRFTEVYWVIYLREKGLSFAAVGLLETVFHIASFVSEVPTGVVADRWGRRASVATGRIVAAASAALVLLSRSWPMMAVAFALNAISYTFHSGAFEALVYDALAEREPREFTKIWGRMNSVYLIGTSAAGGSAALMIRAGLSLDWLYKAAIAADLAALAVCLFMPEDVSKLRSEKKTESAGLFAGLALDVKNMLSALRNESLRNLFLVWAVMSSLGVSIHFYGQSFLKDSLVPLAFIGWAGMAANLISVAPTGSAHLIEKRFGRGRLIAWGSLAMPAAVLVMGIIPARVNWGWRALLIALYLSITVISETLYPIFSNATNALVESRNRAAVLSSGGMLFSVSMMVIFPAVGFIGDRIGLGPGIAVAAILALTALVPLALKVRRSADGIESACEPAATDSTHVR